jgi:hypothetical protein
MGWTVLYTFPGWSAVFALVSRFPSDLPKSNYLVQYYTCIGLMY